MIPLPDRKEAIARVHEAVSQGARKVQACSVLNLSVRTLQRWEQHQKVRCDQRKYAERLPPANQLLEEERQAIVDTCNSERFKSSPPSQIVPTLADEGIYLASESTFYRILKAEDQQHHRGRSQKPQKRAPSSHCATGPNQLWSWDITYLVPERKPPNIIGVKGSGGFFLSKFYQLTLDLVDNGPNSAILTQTSL